MQMPLNPASEATVDAALSALVPEELAGYRLDQVLPRLFTAYSRTQLKHYLDEGLITVNGQQWRAKDKVKPGLHIQLLPPPKVSLEWQAEDLPLNKVFEDEAILVLNKPAQQVVHPATGHTQGTLVNALLHAYPSLSTLPRAGIIHRLDKDTTGLMVVAKQADSYQRLVAALQAREIKRLYTALVWGVPISGATIDLPLGRHPIDRKKRAVVHHPSAKPAVTHYRVKEKFEHHACLSVQLETGRTHQIRVHLAHQHYPIVGDQTYGGRLRFPAGMSSELQDCIRQFKRQALHASELGLAHPITGQMLSWTAPLPADFNHLLMTLRSEKK